MAADMGVNEKTIRRDLDLFRAVGFPLEETVGPYNRKSWRMKVCAFPFPRPRDFDLKTYHAAKPRGRSKAAKPTGH
jgi:hypothetical protein